MAAKRTALGSGFSALMRDNSVDDGTGGARTLPLDEIEPNREQARKDFDEAALSELAESIRQHGVLQPLLVRPMPDGGYRLIAGERRWRACRMAGLHEVPVIEREMTDEEERLFSLIENLQREDLNAIEEAQGLRDLIDAFGLTQEQAAQRIGKSRTAVTNALRLLKLPASVAELVRTGKLSMGQARALLAVGDGVETERIAQQVVRAGLSVREVERLVKRLEKKGAQPEKRVRKRDRFYDEAELALSQLLSRKVRIWSGRSGRGTLEIEFFGREDLEKLIWQFEDTE